ncbi:nucleotidyltransferase family protein [Mucilaginibacter sp.]|uniref:nucleotidyltransferase family protein n=1 Tax=Mucilaginibacter sp. TaxID=1882438 RepID=UPI0026283F7D|nr:nucleotidyltransferase domain-containing protein [Mucilaginibacter sp.]MDB4918539.1 nucleotidyltransferase protein [Mucilaginibacter sp.]
MLHATLQSKLPQVTKLFKDHKIKSAFAFGSVVSDNFDDESDIDLLINFEDGLEPLERGEIWWDLHDSLRAVFNREIDLVIENSLKNPYFIEEINEKKRLIYAA